MKKILLFFLIFFPVALLINAQTVIHYESFKTDGNGTRYTVTGGFTDETGDYFIRTNGIDVNKPSGLPSYTFSDGDFFFAGEDTKCSDNPNSDVSFVTISGIDITGASNITIDGLFASGAREKFDPEDYLHIYANIDAAGEILIGAFEADISSGFNTTFFGVDNDFDGIADGPDSLNTVFSEYSFALGSTGNSLDLRIEAYLSAGDEEIAFDSITVSGIFLTDTDPPVWTTDYPYIDSLLDTKEQIAVSIDEPGKVYYIVLYDGATAPDAGQVITGEPYDTVTICVHDSIDISAANTEYKQWIENATPETPYDIYVIAQDNESNPNIQTSPVLLECTTAATKSLTFTNPQSNDTIYIGDTLFFEWNAVYVDSILIGGYDYADSSDFLLTEDEFENPAPVSADSGNFKIWIPYNVNTDSVKFYLYDAEEAESIADSLLIYLIDTIPPMIKKTTPANGSTGFLPAGQFTLYFTENVSVGTGNIYLCKASGTPVDTFDVTEIYFDQNLFSFAPDLPLEPETEYYFEIDAGIVTDWKNRGFGAITDSNTWSFTVATNELYFSEYIEGNSYNKALEIYNPTTQTVDLSSYGIVKNTNGGSWQDPDPLSGMLDPGDVYVIINAGFNFSLIDSAAVVDTIWGFATNHNGNDGRALVKLIEGSWIENHAFSFIDMIGSDSGDPVDGWDVAGVSAATKNHTMLRKAAISIGNTDFTESAGTSAENSEWKVFDRDFSTNLGYATPDASDETEIIEFTLFDTPGNNITVNTTINNQTYTINVEVLYGMDSVPDSLVPEITLSEGATSDPASGDTVDFVNPVIFTVTAEDEFTTQDWTITITEEVIPDISIYDIQFTTETSGDSPHINEQVRVSGIATAIDVQQGNLIGYFLQDSSDTWNGIYVYDPERDSIDTGDNLTIVATINENLNVTQVSGIVEYIKNSTGNTLPDPLVITTGITDPEQYEGVLVTVENAICTNNDMGNEEIELNDGSGAIIIDNYLYDYSDSETFTISNIYRITGLMHYSSGIYKILPRSINDIENVTAVKDPVPGALIRIYPNPNNGYFKLIVNNFKSGSRKIEIINLQGQILYQNTINDPTGFSKDINMTKYDKGLYLIRISDGNKTMFKKILIR